MSKQSNSGVPLPAHIREWMLSIGYVSEQDMQDATCASHRSRARWKSLKPVLFGNHAYYRLIDVKRHMDTIADASFDIDGASA